VEQWVYKRYRLAEHHSISGLACSATPVPIGHVAATKTVRAGSGGVMLPNHAPLVVAEQFGTLEAMYPGRIDLALGRAPGGAFQTMRALRRDLRQSGEDFPALLDELRTYLGPEKPGQVVKAIPGQGSNVPITLLGSNGFSAQLANDRYRDFTSATSGRLFQFDPQSAEFKSKTKTRAIANDTSNTDRPARCSELDFHQIAGLKVDPGIELHARAA